MNYACKERVYANYEIVKSKNAMKNSNCQTNPINRFCHAI